MDLLPAPACCLALLILVPEGISAPQPTELAPLRQEELDELTPFTAPEGISEEQFAEWVELAGSLNARSRQTLLNSGRSAMPAVVNAMLAIDYSTKRGSRKGRDCHRLLAELVGQETPSRWVLTAVPEEAVANNELIQDWYLKCERSIGDDEEWWRLCGFEPEPLLTALGATGLPDGIVRDFLKLQDEIEEARAKFQLERAEAEERLKRLEIEGERELRLALAESLPESWDAGGAQALSPEMVARQLRGELELTWPLGLYESLRDTLRTADRKALQNQRTMRVEGLSEEIEVSVKTFGDSQYAVVPLVRTWPEARDICLANGGHLACIGSPEELEVVTSLMTAVNFRSSPVLDALETDLFFWLGASDAEVEGTWTWTDGRPVDPELWLEPARDANGKVAKLPFTLGDDVKQPNNNGGMEHRAVLIEYEPTHAPKLNYGKRWGLADWYSGFPGRFICEWGPEPFEGPWQGQTQRFMEPYLLEYFRSRADLEDEIEMERQKQREALDRTRKRALSTAKSMAKDLSRELRRRVKSERQTMTERQIFAAEQLCWKLEESRLLSRLSSLESPAPADAADFMNARYKVFTTARTHAEAEQACRDMGGCLVTMHMSVEAANLTVGSDIPNLQLVDGDLECQFLQALMLEAGVNTAWVGYRLYQGYGAPEYRYPRQWMELESGQPVDVPWFIDELEPSFTPSFPSWWPYHTVGGFLLATASPESSVTYVASAAQERFPFPFTGVPGFSVKALVNGARVTKEQLGDAGKGFSFDGPDHAREILFDGVPLQGGERVSFYASPVNCGPILLRLPYICVWDS